MHNTKIYRIIGIAGNFDQSEEQSSSVSKNSATLNSVIFSDETTGAFNGCTGLTGNLVIPN
jgi:hypothetical protein